MWNAPVEQEQHAERACRAALGMLAEMPGLEADWREVLGSRLTLGIGIHTGTAQVGNTGSSRKVKYGPHGHTVNLASRLQSLCKPFSTPLIVSAATRSRLRDEFAGRRLGTVRVHGIDTPVEIHELLPPGRESPEMYEAGQFQDAQQILGRWLEAHSLQSSDVALKRLIEYKNLSEFPFQLHFPSEKIELGSQSAVERRR